MIVTSFQDSTTTAGVTYYGESLKPGAVAGDAAFRITSYTAATKKWAMANGTAARNLTWAGRAGYTYT